MVWFLSCCVVALILTARSIVNLFRDRFPNPVDVATLSIFYYGVPLAMAGYFDLNYKLEVFLAAFAADQQLAVLSIQYVVIALVCLQFGRTLGARLGLPRLTRFGVVDVVTLERVRFTFFALLLLIGGGIYLFGFQEFLAGYATDSLDDTGSTGNAVIYVTIEFIGIAIAYAMIIGTCTGRTPFKTLIGICVTVLLAILVFRAKRLEVVSGFIPPALVLLSRRSSITAASWRLIGGVVAAAALVIVSILRVSGDTGPGDVAFLLFSEGLYAGHSLPGITERLQAQLLNHEHGVRFVNALLGFVPRFVWEGKDDMVYAGNMALKGVSPLGATSLLAEVVLQGGATAVAICYTVMGFFLERIARFRDAWDESIAAGVIPSRVGAYFIAVAIFIPHFRDGIIPAVKLALQAAVFFAFLSGMRLFSRARIVALPRSTAHASHVAATPG